MLFGKGYGAEEQVGAARSRQPALPRRPPQIRNQRQRLEAYDISPRPDLAQLSDTSGDLAIGEGLGQAVAGKSIALLESSQQLTLELKHVVIVGCRGGHRKAWSGS